jgi:hypothetical protein
MFKKAISLVGVSALLLVTSVSCTKSSDSSNSKSRNSAAVSVPALDAYVPGTPAHSSDVVATSVYATEGGAASGAELAPIFAAYPILETYANELGNVNKMVLTSDSHLELYDVDTLVMVLLIAGDSATVVWSRNEFTADSIAYSSEEIPQTSFTSAAIFNLSACTAAPVEPPVDNGQGQGQDKGQVKEPVCQTISVRIDSNEAQQKQDQSQDKGQDKGQDKLPVNP